MTAHLIWALVVAGLVATNCATHARLESAQNTIKVYERDSKTQKDEAAQLLADEIAKKEAAEQALAAFKAEQEKQDALTKIKVDGLADQLARAGGPSRRLRDPNATDRCGGGGGSPQGTAAAPATGGAGDEAEAGGLLSVQLSALLGTLLRESDTINRAYASCRGTAMNDRGMPPEPEQ